MGVISPEYGRGDTDSRVTGRFTFEPATDTWRWDDEVYRIHGLEPGSVHPDSEFVLACKHPDDRERVRALLERVVRTGESFSLSYRLVAADGTEKRVVLVGEGDVSDAGGSTRIDGYYIDLTQDFVHGNEEHAAAAVAAAAANSAVIEQAKGILMLAYGLGEEQAFAMLRWWSRHRDLNVRVLAERLVQRTPGGQGTDVQRRHELDALLHDLTLS